MGRAQGRGTRRALHAAAGITLRAAVGAAVVTPVVLTGAAALAAPSPAPSASGSAPSASGSAPVADAGSAKPDLVIGGVQTSPGSIRFYVTPHNLPSGTTLTRSLAVTADGETLTSTATPVDSSAIDAADPGTRGAVLVLDTSAAMAGPALDAARDAAASYSAALPVDVKLGLVTVGNQPASVVPPTTGRAAFDAAVNQVTTKGGRSLYDGLHEAARMLVNDPAFVERRIVVLTDGPDTASVENAADISSELGLDKITMDVATYGAGGTDVTALATATGGQVVRAADAAALRTAFTGLGSSVSPPVLVAATVPAYLGTRTSTVSVSVGAATASTSVTFPRDSRVAVPLREATVSSVPTWVLYLALGVLAAAVLVGATAGVFMMLARTRTRLRLRQIDSFNGANRASGHQEEGNAFVRAALAMSDRAVQRRGDQSRIESALDQGAIALKPNEWILMRVAAAVAGAAVLMFLLPWLLALIAGLVAGWMLPELYRSSRATRRARKFADLLPEALQLVVSALRSGFSLQQAVDALVREGPDPVAGEFSRALAEIRLGGELEDALDRVAVRNNSRDLAWLVMAIRIQREVGGNLSEVMETAVNTMRERAYVARHVRALSAEGRLSAYVLIALPIGVAAFMFVSRGEYLRPLYTQFLGLCMLGTAAVMIAVGAFWLSRLIKVKV